MSSSNPSSRPLIGVFGGTFDPVHQGHLACARYVLEHCALDQLQFMPCHMPPHRASPGVSAQQRATMVELAIADEPAMLLQPLELNRDSASYTADSLSLLKQSMPASTLAFVIGMDSLCYFTSWYHWQRILELSHLIVCQRPGYSRMDGDAPALLKQYAAAPSALRQYTHGKIIELNNPNFSPSATAIREALAQNQQNISELAPSVLNYIQQHRLYQS
ncbi:MULTISPECIES: nicotinate-nucleotide adenylyltransferase [unclassified Arsukibacterium]|uniref:nicotinate-nucleotide adenylyltransferase n=1 Tax=unclassified Arsukibacterium TaxID=2635278 RepID=UPI000C67EE87|nr:MULTISPECIES: nicotinate-nucleotide adenylyltransferase [unclassified Arsukibacterium]MAA96636.1 nicotinate-nicotinamide nucleotide adenylyltransferase [Rheinheimera sp.]MBM34512.1 nicotinate-nicotinamide nucleotide adenylyltransferase [Rheinheimera sp.]HAW91934.1 nicotinate-nucleotide adenylyltransferase [Candidatus Azambacteria bacterium]|tara:strand:+ start:53293 stop:53946 length:654 start_codon:yes stop_codon:yes gene_type:complete